MIIGRKRKMNEIIAAGALSFIFIMTTLGAACVFFTEKCKRYEILNGFAAGVMLAAAFWSLLLPAADGARSAGQPPWVIVSVGVLCGVAFIALPDLFNRKTDGANRVFRAVTLHNIPEGMSVGVAFGTPGVSVAGAVGVALAIGLQNFPEGLATSLPFVEKNGRKKAFLFGMLSGAVEPVFGAIGLLLAEFTVFVQPFMLAFSAGAMNYVCIRELIPESCIKRGGRLGFFAGFIIMMCLDILFN